jgi:UDP-glucose 4-epimerase
VLEHANIAGVKRVVLASSAAVYGDVIDFPLKEIGRINPLSPYATSKYISEILSQMYTHQLGLEVVAMRYFNIFGPRQNPDSDYAAVIPRFIQKMILSEIPLIYGDGNQSRDFVFISDVVRANLLAGQADTAPGQVINVCGGMEISVMDLLKTLSHVFDRDIDPIFKDSREGDIYRSVGDVSLAREVLGFQPETSLRSGLEATVEWMKGSRSD